MELRPEDLVVRLWDFVISSSVRNTNVVNNDSLYFSSVPSLNEVLFWAAQFQTGGVSISYDELLSKGHGLSDLLGVIANHRVGWGVPSASSDDQKFKRFVDALLRELVALMSSLKAAQSRFGTIPVFLLSDLGFVPFRMLAGDNVLDFSAGLSSDGQFVMNQVVSNREWGEKATNFVARFLIDVFSASRIRIAGVGKVFAQVPEESSKAESRVFLELVSADGNVVYSTTLGEAVADHKDRLYRERNIALLTDVVMLDGDVRVFDTLVSRTQFLRGVAYYLQLRLESWTYAANNETAVSRVDLSLNELVFDLLPLPPTDTVVSQALIPELPVLGVEESVIEVPPNFVGEVPSSNEEALPVEESQVFFMPEKTIEGRKILPWVLGGAALLGGGWLLLRKK